MDCRVAMLLAMTIFVIPANCAYAQSDNGYAPPPMFDDMTPPMVRPEAQDGYIVEPKKSANTQLPPSAAPARGKSPITAPRVSTNPGGTDPAPSVVPPVAPRTPALPVQATPPKMKPIIESSPAPVKKPVITPPVKPVVKKPAVVTPVPPPKPIISQPQRRISPAIPDAPSPKPVAGPAPEKKTVSPRDPSQSVITGPKTMPALPATSVDGQVIFEDKKEPENGETMLERRQRESQEQKSETLAPVTPMPNPNVTPAEFEKGSQGALKRIIPFTPGQIGLATKDADPIAAGVVKELGKDEKKDWRVQIKSYATPHGTGLSSDRRIALNRALSLRSTLITQGVSASRIDVMAEGLQTDGSGPADRIDLYLYGPPEQ